MTFTKRLNFFDFKFIKNKFYFQGTEVILLAESTIQKISNRKSSAKFWDLIFISGEKRVHFEIKKCIKKVKATQLFEKMECVLKNIIKNFAKRLNNFILEIGYTIGQSE